MKKFDYIKYFKPEIYELKTLGSQGWELVAIDEYNYYIFKKEIEENISNI